MTNAQLQARIVPLRWALLVALAAIVAAFAAVPNPMRAMVPTLFGMTQIAPGVYTDDSRYSAHIFDVINDGAAITEDFFGPRRARPDLIICTTAACDQTFATENRAYAHKDSFILVGHTGLHAHVIAHEMVHAEMHQSLGNRARARATVPAWLNEGLAAYVSGDVRPTRFETPDALWVLEAQHLSDWHRLTHAHSWQDTYGAAQSLIAGLDRDLGRHGLVSLVMAMQQGLVPQDSAQNAILSRIN